MCVKNGISESWLRLLFDERLWDNSRLPVLGWVVILVYLKETVCLLLLCRMAQSAVLIMR